MCRRACALLREARSVTYRWMGEIGIKIDSMQDEIARASLRHRLCMLAATCFSTFDVSSEHMPAALTSEEDFSIAIQSAVIVHDNTPPSLSDENALYLTRMLSRHLRLLHHLEPVFSQSMDSSLSQTRLLHSTGFDRALARLWLGYHQPNFSNWNALPRPKSRWIFCVTERGRDVHYDLLSGELLIGGKRLGRLPQEIVEHPTYASLLGTVSDQCYFFNAQADVSSNMLLENFRRGARWHPRNGLCDTIHHVWVSGKELAWSITSVLNEANSRSYFHGITGI